MNYRKDVKIEDFLIVGAYYRLIKESLISFYVHLVNNVFGKNDVRKIESIISKFNALETELGFETALFSYLDNNPNDEGVQKIKDYKTSVFYGPISWRKDNDDPVDNFARAFILEKFINISGLTKGMKMDDWLIEPGENSNWKATVEGNAETINFLEDIITKIYEKDHKED